MPNSMPLVSAKIVGAQAAGPTRQTSVAGAPPTGPRVHGTPTEAAPDAVPGAPHATARLDPSAATNLADGRAATSGHAARRENTSRARAAQPPQAQAQADTFVAASNHAPPGAAARHDAMAAMARPLGASVRAGANAMPRPVGATTPKRPTTAAALGRARAGAGPTRAGAATPNTRPGRTDRADDDDPARARPRPNAALDAVAPGTLAPAVRPAVPAAFGAAITALGYVQAARRAQQAAQSFLQAGLRPPVADAPRPRAAAVTIGVSVGGPPPAALGAAR